MGIALAFLFVLQIISFLIMTLFYMKFSKFQTLERKQRKLMEEMEHSAAAFIAEIKEENDRLIQQIERRETAEAKKQPKQPLQEKAQQAGRDELFEKIARPLPVQAALRSYQKNTQPAVKEEKKAGGAVQAAPSDFQQAKKLYDEGKSIEEIAKQLGKGRTEIELLLKFG